ncbi:cupin domain-containing protein [Flavisphingomonas formosensis]|uniref:cupin domain-containing protein n=1 Tax=Flavisphingomonas formosensis TaxID=861534 RepID=UPI0012FB208D|nr:cupin domain-containing protein [Sphingomonas formosensis]
MQDDAQAIIARLGLAPHPEGGWYRETWRADAPAGVRASATAILFLLESGQKSHWHRVDAAELWLWHAGSPLLLKTWDEAAPPHMVRLGGDVLAGETPQHLIHPGEWQAAVADRDWTLVSCIVSPGFEFAGFSLAPEGWQPARAIGADVAKGGR